MILVTVGTNEAPFDRLLRALETRPDAGEELLVQHGPSAVRPSGATCVDFLSYEDLVDAIRRARVVVTHAGVGSIMTSLANHKLPVVVPRLRRFREAVDDHQLALGRRLHAAGLVALVEDESRLALALEGSAPVPDVELGPSLRLVADLRAFVAEQRGVRHPAARLAPRR